MITDSDFISYRLSQLRRSIQLLRETIDCNFPPNAPVENALANLELEAKLLSTQINKEK